MRPTVDSTRPVISCHTSVGRAWLHSATVNRYFLKVTLAIALLVFGGATAAAALDDCVRIGVPTGEYSARYQRLEELRDPDCRLTVDEVRSRDREWREIEGEDYGRADGTCAWFRICVSTAAENELFFETGIHSESELYIFIGDSAVAHHEMGNALPLSQRASSLVWSKAYRNLAPVSLTPGFEHEVYFRVHDPTGPNLFATGSTKELRVWDDGFVRASAQRHQLTTAFVTGWLVLLILYQFTVWVITRNRLVFWYLVYMVSQLAYLSYEDFIVISLLPDVAVDDAWLVLTIAVAPYCFFRFLRELLRQVDPRPAIGRLLWWFAAERLALGVIWLGAVALVKSGVDGLLPMLTYIPIYYRVVLLMQILVTLPIFVSFYRRNDILAAKALTIGNVALALCIFAYVAEALLVPYATVAPIGAVLSFLRPAHSYLVELGVIIMSLAFAIAVGLVVRDRERAKDRETSRKLMQVEMSALRAQMNPHFLFNGLNSIKLFVIRNQPREASDYLTRFSRLIRMILENSAESMIPLQADLDVLRLYIDLESLRFEGRFDCRFDVDEAVDTHRVLIPPTLIQPYVENAIWHGLLHRSAPGGLLEVAIRWRQPGCLEIVVRDNGVGRAAAQRLRSRSATRHKSLGMQITQDRLDMLGAAYGFTADVTVVDLQAGGAPAGTEVLIALTYSTAAAVAERPTLNLVS